MAVHRLQINVMGGLASVLGAIACGVLLRRDRGARLGLLSPAYKDLYGCILLIGLLVVRPTGLFGERERMA